MADPIGENTYKGLAVPLYGESLLLQQNSSNAIWTFQHSSANEGRFLAGRNHSYSTVLGDADQYSSVLTSLVWDIDADGGYRAVSGETVLVELNSSVLEGRSGTTASWSIDSSGRMLGLLGTVNVVTTGADFTITSTMSGTFFSIGRNDGTSQRLLLPGDAPDGTWFEFYLTSQDVVDDVTITSTAGTGRIHMNGTPTSIVSSGEAITPASTLPISVKLTKVATDIWSAVGQGYSHTSADSSDISAVDIVRGTWQSGTIVA